MGPTKVIDLAALRRNADLIRTRCSRFYAVVKADAYGHGLREVVLTDLADGYCVARAEEGLAVRSWTTRPVLVMGTVSESEAETLAIHDVTVACTDKALLKGFASAAKRACRPLKIWIKVDTGMHRYGLTPAETEELTLPEGVVETGRFTHLATDEPFRVDRALLLGGENLSYAATQNLVRLGGVARVGLGLYGYGLPDAQPVMRLQSVVLGVRDVAAGEYVGYGSAYRARKAVKIAVIGIGYADGFRRVENVGSFLFQGRRLPVVGTVCMDVTMADATGVPIRIGDTVTLPDAEELSKTLGGIPYEYLTCWTARVEKHFTETT